MKAAEYPAEVLLHRIHMQELDLEIRAETALVPVLSQGAAVAVQDLQEVHVMKPLQPMSVDLVEAENHQIFLPARLSPMLLVVMVDRTA